MEWLEGLLYSEIPNKDLLNPMKDEMNTNPSHYQTPVHFGTRYLRCIKQLRCSYIPGAILRVIRAFIP